MRPTILLGTAALCTTCGCAGIARERAIPVVEVRQGLEFRCARIEVADPPRLSGVSVHALSSAGAGITSAEFDLFEDDGDAVFEPGESRGSMRASLSSPSSFVSFGEWHLPAGMLAPWMHAHVTTAEGEVALDWPLELE